jgi:hypothetical protein
MSFSTFGHSGLLSPVAVWVLLWRAVACSDRGRAILSGPSRFAARLDAGVNPHKPLLSSGGKTIRKLGSAFLIAAGAALAAATLYDASVLTWALGLSIEGSEATVALASLSLSAIVLLLGVLGFGKRRQEDALRSTG